MLSLGVSDAPLSLREIKPKTAILTSGARQTDPAFLLHARADANTQEAHAVRETGDEDSSGHPGCLIETPCANATIGLEAIDS
jgi:hypothetical protein